MAPPMRGFIFDLDGTLVDTLADITNSLNHVLSELGMPNHPAERTREWVGWGARYLVEQAIDDATRIDEAVTRFRAHYAENLIVDSAPYAGVSELLAELASRQVPLGVLSNKPHAMTVSMIQALFADTPWIDVRGHRPPTPQKPDPTGAVEIASAMQLDPGQISFVGDTAVDMETATRAGMIPIAVAWGFRSADTLRDSGCARLIHEPGELLD